ncbi:MAG: glycosyltransferase family 4 protein [Candidatus Hodarchaeota archaeon]
MITYSDYLTDTRVRREAETLASLPEYNVKVLAPKRGSLSCNYEIDNVKVLEMNVEKYRGSTKSRYIWSYIIFMAISFFTCMKLFMSKKIEIVHVHNMPDFLVFAGIVPRLFGKKLILDIHDTMPETYTAKFGSSSSLLFKVLRLEELICCGVVQKIICVNHVQRDVLLKRGIPSDKVSVSLNVPDHKRFDLGQMKRDYGIKNDCFRMVYHGLIVRRLGIDLVIKVIAQLVDEISNIEFHVWGKYGDDFDDLDGLSKELRVEDRIHFVREGVPFERVPFELKRMDIGIVGNRKNIATEIMLPVKLLEYVAIGIPVVVPRLKAIEYYFSDEMVCYFEPENVDSLASAILKLYKDKSLRRAQAQSAKAFLAQYGWDKHQEDFIDLYREI